MAVCRATNRSRGRRRAPQGESRGLPGNAAASCRDRIEGLRRCTRNHASSLVPNHDRASNRRAGQSRPPDYQMTRPSGIRSKSSHDGMVSLSALRKAKVHLHNSHGSLLAAQVAFLNCLVLSTPLIDQYVEVGSRRQSRRASRLPKNGDDFGAIARLPHSRGQAPLMTLCIGRALPSINCDIKPRSRRVPESVQDPLPGCEL